ncbi:MAG: MFS transporter [Thermoleophilia bacterium]|nr:MFS transporter [Thermoleophilia bacterium]
MSDVREEYPAAFPVRQLLTAPVVGWALYDFANTIFSYAVVTRYFNDWITEQKDAPDWQLGLMLFGVGVALVVALPVSGALADRVGRRMPFLLAFTLLCVAATAALGAVEATVTALLLGGVAIFAFQNGLAHYDPLLADLAPERLRGRVSGFGAGVGYAGALIALVALGIAVGEGDNQRAFVPTAALFLLFALPCFVLVRERRREAAAGSVGEVARAALAQVGATLRRAREYGDVWRFLLARFLYVDAVGTIIAFMLVYAGRMGEMSAAAETALIGLSIVFAGAGALAAGAAVERVGPRRVLVSVLGLLVAAMLAAALVGGTTVLWLVGPVVGVALGTVATADRVFLLRLAPAVYRGEFFGLATLVGRLSSGIGPLVLWGGTIFVLADLTGAASEAGASRVAVVVLAAACLAGILVLRRIDDRPRAWSAG